MRNNRLISKTKNTNEKDKHTKEFQQNIFMEKEPHSYLEKENASLNDKNNQNKNNNDIQILNVYTDGAAKGNPGEAGAGIIVLDKLGRVLLKKHFYLGEKTNNQAEYLAVLLALFLIFKMQLSQQTKVKFFSDSELLVRQMNNHYKVKDPILKKLKEIINNFLNQFEYSFTHILRHLNKEADKLANEAIKKKSPLPLEFLKLLKEKHVFNNIKI